MIGVLAGVIGLLVAGFAFGCVRRRWPRSPSPQSPRTMQSRTKTLIILAIIAFPFGTLMLAKLFSSDVLGWVFGLTLGVGMALVPCAAIFYLGLRVGLRGARSRASQHDAAANVVVQIERGTVHASDDAPSKQISIAPRTTLREMVALAIADSDLPSISGGMATWVVESSGNCADVGMALRPIGVWAQQWAQVKFLVPVDISVAAHFGSGPKRLNLRYRCQTDPDAVFMALRST